jgi:hypothetical protein
VLILCAEIRRAGCKPEYRNVEEAFRGLDERRVTSGVSKVFLRIARKSILFEQKT